MAWICLVELVGSDLPLNPGCEQSPIASVTDTHKVSYCLGCDRVTLTSPPSGMMSQHCAERCSQESTSSLEDFHVRTSVLQELEKAWQESEVVFSSRSSDSSKSATPDLFSSKTSLPSEPVEGKEWLKNWPRSGMTVDGRLYLPPQLEPHTSAKGGFSWPTPSATEGGPLPPDTDYRPNQRSYNSRTGNHVQITLRRAVQMWPTPTASDHLHNQSEMLENWQKRAEEKKKQGINLQFALRHAVQMWPTPRASEYKDCGPVGSKSQIHMHKRDYLCAKAKDQSNPTGQLSPMWVEWLMGYRIGHTELDVLVIQWFRSKSGKRSKN